MQPNPTCSSSDCERPKYVRGMCRKHYTDWLYENRPRDCAADDCDRRSGKKSKYCPMHSGRMYYHGTLDAPVRHETCTIDGCDDPFLAKGMCNKHYHRSRNRDSLDDPQRMTIAERIERKVTHVEMGHGTPCWIYEGSLNSSGYTCMKTGHGDDRRTELVHRASYREYVGPIPAGLVIDHLCRVRTCCNPEHLEPVTQGENIRRIRRAS